MVPLVRRNLVPVVREMLGGFRIVVLGGARQTGKSTLVDDLLELPAPSRFTLDHPGVRRLDLVDWMVEGGYPEVVAERLSARRRGRWFDSYVAEVVSREALPPLADVRGELEMRRVLRLLAARTAQELVVSDLARDAELDRSTVASYLGLLEALFLVVRLPAFATSATTRAKRRPKILVTDPGLAAHLANAGAATFGPSGDARLAGSLFETTVLTEIAKQATWSEHLVDLSHFRDRNGPEVDLVVEDRRTGAVAGVEVELGASPTVRDVRHLALLRNAVGERFTVGVVVHTGPHSLPLGERLWAVPVSTLWRDD